MAAFINVSMGIFGGRNALHDISYSISKPPPADEVFHTIRTLSIPTSAPCQCFTPHQVFGNRAKKSMCMPFIHYL